MLPRPMCWKWPEKCWTDQNLADVSALGLGAPNRRPAISAATTEGVRQFLPLRYDLG